MHHLVPADITCGICITLSLQQVLYNFVKRNYAASQLILAASGVEHSKLVELARPMLEQVGMVPAKIRFFLCTMPELTVAAIRMKRLTLEVLGLRLLLYHVYISYIKFSNNIVVLIIDG